MESNTENIPLMDIVQPLILNIENQDGKPPQSNTNTKPLIYQTMILNALKKRNFEQFNILLISDDIDIDYIYPELNQTCLNYAITHKCGLNFVDSLLRAGADCNKQIDNKTPLHLAIESKQLEIVERLLREETIIIGTSRNKAKFAACDSPLNFLVKEAIKKERISDDRFYIECVKVLLQNEEDPNIPNTDGKTPIVIAVENQNSELVSTILDNSQYNVVSTKYNGSSDKTVYEVINEKKLYTSVLPLKTAQPEKITKLFILIRKKEVEEFIECLNTLDGDDRNEFDLKFNSLLRHAVKMKSEKAVDELLKWSDKVKSIVPDNKKLLIDWACFRGNETILTALLEKIDVTGEVLNAVAMKFIKNEFKEDEKIKACVTLLLGYEKMPINHQDQEGNTILHYVTKNMDEALIKLCLERGASVSVKNKMGEIPLTNINPKLFEDYLNRCVTKIEKRGHDVIAMNFSSLEPCKMDDFKHEMDLCRYMRSDDNYKHLLKHPLIETFIVVKCDRMKIIFYTYFLFYFFISCLLFTYSYVSMYEGQMESKILNDAVHYLLKIYSALLLILKLIQMRYLKRYFKYFENILDIVIITLCFLIIFDKNRLANLVIINILTVICLAFHLAKFKFLSTHISMVETVSFSFLKFILCYSIILLTFSWSFFIIFNNNDYTSDNKDFDTLPVAFFKSFEMLAGEHNRANMVFKTITSYIIVVLFIFLISIVLFKLLNGLAVSDTQTINNDAKLYALISLIEEISYQEDYFFFPQRVFEKLHLRLLENLFKRVSINFFNCVYIFPDNSTDHKMYILYNVNTKIIMDLKYPHKDNIYLPIKLIRSIREIAKKNTT